MFEIEIQIMFQKFWFKLFFTYFCTPFEKGSNNCEVKNIAK